jgi:3-deoxy-manno-octulosonate cytidylyltransferase (CMP-KDO synthetase)
MKTVGVIPARFASTRFPAKVLANIAGKPMIQHVWEKASLCQELDEILIACDHEEVFKAVQNFKARAVMTDPGLASGSDRIAEAVKDLNVDIVVNIQGDEPFVDPPTIDALAVLLKQDPKVMMGTVIKPITDEADILDPNVVKCVVDTEGYALYFTRGAVAYRRDGTNFWTIGSKHLGLYAFRKDFLMEFKDWPKNTWETVERLEQLRALERGVKIKTTVTGCDSMAVDTPQDLQKAIKWFERLK